MGWAFITHPEHWRGGKLLQAPMLIDEHAVPVALGQGWRLLLSDAEMAAALVNVEQNLQSGPLWQVDPGDER